MITNDGKQIIAKYLLGQAPAYASYIAVGCGPKPLNSEEVQGDYSTYKNLDFEMFRVPISSRGIVRDGEESKIVLTAELPTEERYEISEVGIFSAGSNPSAGTYDSKVVLSFTENENWQYHAQNNILPLVSEFGPLYGETENDIAAPSIVNEPVFQSNADNQIFFVQNRSERYERCRFFNNIILMRGDISNLVPNLENPEILSIEEGSDHIHLTGRSVDFARNSPVDELKLAFSLVNKFGNSLTVPDNIRIIVDFSSTDEQNAGQYARFEADLSSLDYDFENNRYFVVKKKLQELVTTTGFTWNAVTVIKVYVSVIVDGAPSDEFYIALDAMRFDNIATINPLYGLTGYSVIQNTQGNTIIKSANTTNYIEFRFNLGVS